MKSDFVGFFGVIAVAIVLIAFKGAGATSVFDTVMASSIEETVASTTQQEPSLAQMLDMNSIVGRGGGTGKLFKNDILATIQDTSLLAYQTVDTEAIDDEEDFNGVRKYEVQEGDVLSAIAFDYSLNIQTLIAANNLANINALKPGTILNIPPIDGIVHVVKKGDTVGSLAKKYKAESDKIISFNNLPLAGDLQIGEELIIPDGVLPAKAIAIVRPVANSKRFAGLPKFDGYYITPATCIITQRAHVRNGYDCANKVGTPIYAAASGQVKFAANSGSNHGYGREVILTHANGTETLYGHFSQVIVVTGETVAQGQLIGYMGNTGRSTGSHLHFEVHGAYNILARYSLRGQVIAKQQ